MKLKSIFKFMAIGIVIICLYISFILNIENFTISNNNKKQEYKNTYYKSDNSSDILSKIGYAIDECYSELTESNIDVIRYNKIIRNILKKYSYIEDNEIDKYISRMQKKGRIKLVYDKFIYINEDEYKLIFTPDVNNIEYRASGIKYNASSTSYVKEESRNENKNEIYEAENDFNDIEELEIVEKFGFEPETLYVQYFYATGEIQSESINEGVYVIEDNKNHIKVEIEVPTYEIVSLQVGFEDYLTIE